MDFSFRGSPQSMHHAASTPQPGLHDPQVIQSRSAQATAYHKFIGYPANWPGAPPINTREDSLISIPQLAIPMAVTFPPVSPAQIKLASENTKLKEKKHGCQLCDKRFDRPSTLKKHLLVHTGEKAWVCKICNRRFGVSSNLNRHYRRCERKWLEGRAADTSGSSPSSTSLASSLSPPLSEPPYCPPPVADKRRHPSNDNRISPPAAGSSSPHKRPRRPPSPIHQWVPNSLRSFDLTLKSLPVAPAPLPPVIKGMYEERDSYDENVNDNPYRSSDWKGRLVGPCYTANHIKDLRAYQRVLVF